MPSSLIGEAQSPGLQRNGTKWYIHENPRISENRLRWHHATTRSRQQIQKVELSFIKNINDLFQMWNQPQRIHFCHSVL
jgi:hypothetical protein